MSARLERYISPFEIRFRDQMANYWVNSECVDSATQLSYRGNCYSGILYFAI